MDPEAWAKRNKLMLPAMVQELKLELQVLDWLEQTSLSVLKGLGVPDPDQPFYVGYAKRMWATAMHLTQNTYGHERDLLHDEYVTRGWDPAVLTAMHPGAEDAAGLKHLRLVLWTVFAEPWSYAEPPSLSLILSEPWSWTLEEPPSMSLILSEPWSWTLEEPPSMSQIFAEPWTYEEPPSMSLVFSEPWSDGLFLIFSESWGYTEPPSMTLIVSEAWST